MDKHGDFFKSVFLGGVPAGIVGSALDGWSSVYAPAALVIAVLSAAGYLEVMATYRDLRKAVRHNTSIGAAASQGIGHTPAGVPGSRQA